MTAQPAPALARVVTSYAEFRENSTTPVDRAEVANSGAVLIVEFDDPLLVSDVAEHDRPRLWQSFAAGIGQAPTATLHAGSQHCVEVRLTPLAVFSMTGMSMHELSDRVVGLEDLFGRTGRDLPEHLAAETDWDGRFGVLDGVFARLADAGSAPDPEVGYAWNTLRRTEGRAVIGDLLVETGWSRARLASRFREQVGVTPKAMARLLRFERAVRLMTEPGHRSLASIALSCAYYDQAHFNRDFRSFAGCSPTEWIAARYTDLPGNRVPSTE